jgi:CDP-diacylglycerol--glycerol-3-phosphate 3-phosphatidyltransferase
LIIFGAVLLAAGEIQAGAIVIGGGAILDSVDGIIARETGTVSPRGALLDTFSDRVEEVAMWTGLAYLTADKPLLVALCAVALGSSLLISFLRAWAEAAGVPGKGGLMGRAERFLLFVFGVGFTSFDWYPLTVFLWVAVGLIGFTVLQRFFAIWMRLGE